MGTNNYLLLATFIPSASMHLEYTALVCWRAVPTVTQMNPAVLQSEAVLAPARNGCHQETRFCTGNDSLWKIIVHLELGRGAFIWMQFHDATSCTEGTGNLLYKAQSHTQRGDTATLSYICIYNWDLSPANYNLTFVHITSPFPHKVTLLLHK